jgi:hypothetical protein
MRKQVCPSGDNSDTDDLDVSSGESSDDSDSSNDAGNFSDVGADSDESGKERSQVCQNIIQRLSKKRPLSEDSDVEVDEMNKIRDSGTEQDKEKGKEMEMEMEQDKQKGKEQDKQKEKEQDKQKGKEQDKQKGKEQDKQKGKEQEQEQVKKKGKEKLEEFLPGSYVVVMYEGEWYVGEVICKDGEPEAEGGENYVYVNFMKHSQQGSKGERLVWPKKMDKLNVLREDILVACQPPTPDPGTSTIREVTYSLSKADIVKTKKLFACFKAYYPTKIIIFSHFTNKIIKVNRILWFYIYKVVQLSYGTVHSSIDTSIKRDNFLKGTVSNVWYRTIKLEYRNI